MMPLAQWLAGGQRGLGSWQHVVGAISFGVKLEWCWGTHRAWLKLSAMASESSDSDIVLGELATHVVGCEFVLAAEPTWAAKQLAKFASVLTS